MLQLDLSIFNGNSKIIMNTINNLDNIKKQMIYISIFTYKLLLKKRNDCYMKLIDYIRISDIKMEEDYFDYLTIFKFALCPVGNGVDTYRLWECFYFKLIPIIAIDNILIRFIKEKI